MIYSDPSNLQRTSPMRDRRQGIKPRIPLKRTRNYWEDLPQRDIIQKTNENDQRLKFQNVQNSARKHSQDYRQSSYYPCHRREMETEENTLTPSCSQRVLNRPGSPVASNQSGTRG
ncbi:hypothetical protein O181_025956 [Austropuccinia psidii MF-1]|uniref:Uncharacterized protein n=1 Tax=Austropuccinia psidii MF-1 TaxID=1389203 RepID=A0A9Q3CJK8_9BASI|nr:hypothetical protein [Austropuccinia psidii MF-1]